MSQDSSSDRSRSEWLALAAILLLGFLLRAWYLGVILHAPDFTAPQQDPDVQDYYARALISGDWAVREGCNDPHMRTTPYFRPPGHGYLLTAIYWLTHGSYLAPRLFNIGLGLASIWLMYRLGKRVYGRAEGLITAFFMAVDWGFIYWEGEINDPVLFVFLMPCLLLAMHAWGCRMTVRWAVVLGIIFGSYALMRPNILAFGPFAAAWNGRW